MYRGDKYVPSAQSWEAVLFDKKLRGKVTMYDEGVAIIKIGALINGHQNVNTLTQKQINQSRDTMIKAKANIVSFWQSETQAMQDFISGKVWVTYAWPDTYAQVIAKPSMKNAKVVYMQPKEGQLAWICSFAIAAKPKNEDLAYAYLNTAYSTPAMDYLVNAFFTGGSAMTPDDPRQDATRSSSSSSTSTRSRRRSSRRRCGSSITSRTATRTSRPTSRSSRPDRRCAGRAARPPAPRLSPWQRRVSAPPARPRRPAGVVARTLSTYLLLLARRRRCCSRSSSRRSTTSSSSRPASATRASPRPPRSSTASSTSFSWDRWRELLGTRGHRAPLRGLAEHAAVAVRPDRDGAARGRAARQSPAAPRRARSSVGALVLLVLPFIALPVGTSVARIAEITSENPSITLFFRSISTSLTVSVIAVLMAFPVAYYLAFCRGKSKYTWLVIVIAPFLTSYLLRVLAFKVILTDDGLVNTFLFDTGLRADGHQVEWLLYTQFTVLLVLLYAWVPFVALPIFVALENMDRRLLEAATDLGASRLRAFVKITLPLAAPGIVAAFLFVFIPTIGEFVTPQLVGGSKGYLFGSAIADDFGQNSDWQIGRGARALPDARRAAADRRDLALPARHGRWAHELARPPPSPSAATAAGC